MKWPLKRVHLAAVAVLVPIAVALLFTKSSSTGGRLLKQKLAQLSSLTTTPLISKLLYDDNYLLNELDDKYPYLKLANGSYIAPRDYFNFSAVLRPTDDFLETVNMEEYLYQELRATELVATKHFCSKDIWHYSDQEELRLSGWPEANEEECLRDLAYLSKEIELAKRNTSRLFERGRKNIQLLRWIDCWGRPVAETYYGNSYWVGSYRGCKLTKVPRVEYDNQKDMEFRYCWGKVLAKGWPEVDDIIPRTSLRVGLCLPRSCDTSMANKQMDTIHQMLMFNFSPMQQDRYGRLIHIYCLPNNNRVSLSTKIFLVASIAWLSLILAASLGQLWLDNHSRRPLPVCLKYLTVQENYARFLADDAPSPRSRVDLRPLGIIKLFACLAICIGHCFVESYLNYFASTLMFIERQIFTLELSDLFFKILELFTVLSGILGSYIILSKFPGSNIRQIIQPKVYLGLNLARYLRLAPVLVITLAFIKSTFVYLSDGPFWDYGTGAKYSQLGLCRLHLSWWRILLWPIVFDVNSSGGSHYKMECLPASWYIVTEMKMFLVVPLYIYLMTRRGTRHITTGLLLTTISVVVSMLWHLNHIETQRVYYPEQMFHYGRLQIDHMIGKIVESTYFSGIHRFHAVAIGLFAGFQLYRYKLGHLRKWPFWMRGVYLLPLFVWLSFDVVSSTLNELKYRRYGTIPNVEFIKLFPVVKQRLDAITYAILSLRLATDWAPRLMRNTMLIYKLSKLSYCVYIVHTILIVFFMSATEKSRPDAQPLQLFIIFIFIITASLIIALPMYILFESPLALLLSHFMESNKLAKQSTLAPYGNNANKRGESNRKPQHEKQHWQQHRQQKSLGLLDKVAKNK